MATATKAKKDIKIHPLEDRVVVLPAEETEAMRGGLYIPDTAKEKPTQGEVIAVGPGRTTDKGERIALDIKVGDTGSFHVGFYSDAPMANDWTLKAVEGNAFPGTSPNGGPSPAFANNKLSITLDKTTGRNGAIATVNGAVAGARHASTTTVAQPYRRSPSTST